MSQDQNKPLHKSSAMSQDQSKPLRKSSAMPQDQNNPLRQEKMRKRQELLDKGLDPYPHNWAGGKKRKKSLQLIEIFKSGKQGAEYHIAGRLMRKRPMGKAAFFNIQDEEGEFQCYIKREDFSKSPEGKNGTETPSPWDVWKLADIGDILGLSGELFQTKKGEISLRVKDLQMLCKSLESLPEKYHGLEDKELKYRYRHLDLIMSKESRKTFKTRSKLIHEIRSFMNKKGFMEVETPVLQSIYGGAVARPFETYFHRLNNQKMYLKISPEIYLKKLLVGGFEKVFEIGKNFRNEGIDRSHNPEFTMMEYYEAYTDYKDQMDFFEELVCEVVRKTNSKESETLKKSETKHDLKKPEEKQDLKKPEEKHDLKKPEEKQELKIVYQGKELDLSSPWIRISPKQFEELFYSIALPPALNDKAKSFSFEYLGKKQTPKDFFETINKEIQERREKEQRLKSEKRWTQEQKWDFFQKFWEEITGVEKREKKESLSKVSKGKKEQEANPKRESLHYYELLLNYVKYMDPKGDFEKFNELLSTNKAPSEQQVSSYRRELSLLALEQTVEKYFWNPVFILDFPIEVSPLTKKHRNQAELVERFEPYIAGMEIGNAYTELNDPVDQRQRLEKQERYSKKQAPLKDKKESDKSKETAHPMDENFLHALEVGMPPTGGVGLGIERLVMILTDQSHIKDSMLFPTLREK